MKSRMVVGCKKGMALVIKVKINVLSEKWIYIEASDLQNMFDRQLFCRMIKPLGFRIVCFWKTSASAYRCLNVQTHHPSILRLTSIDDIAEPWLPANGHTKAKNNDVVEAAHGSSSSWQTRGVQ